MPYCGRVAGVDICLFGPPTASDVHRISSSSLSSSLFADESLYPCRGTSLTSSPRGYRVNVRTATLGRGKARLRHAARALQTGDAMELPWARLWRCGAGAGARWAAGDLVVIAARVLPAVWVVNVNSVVAARSTRRSLTLTWGTTARHVLRGEESVHVERDHAGDVSFTLRSFSRPHAVAAWLGYPLAVLLQTRYAADVARRVQMLSDDDPPHDADAVHAPPVVERGRPKQENLQGRRRFRYRGD